jgi:short-subunit dehydrogenase
MRVTIVTGASDGIGAEIARQIARRDGAGAGLVLAARSADRLAALADELRGHGARAEAIVTDVSDRAACNGLIAATMEQFGRIDVLLNNAGMSAHANFAEVSESDLGWYERLMAVNFWGAVWLTHAALPHLAQTQGRIAAVSSVAGLIGVPGRTAYSATKFALAGFFEALRQEVAHQGVSVTVAYPGIVDTQTRRRGLNAKGGMLGTNAVKDDAMMPVDVCARMIIEGIDRRRREVLMTRQMRLGRWLKLIAPGLTDKIAMMSIKEEFRPGRSHHDRLP